MTGIPTVSIGGVPDPLPDGLELSRLLRDAGVDLRWNGELLVPPTSVTSRTRFSTIPTSSPAQVIASTVAVTWREERILRSLTMRTHPKVEVLTGGAAGP